MPVRGTGKGLLRACFFLVPLLTAIASPSTSGERDADDLIARIALSVDGLHAVRARFRQEVEMILMGETRKYEGNVYYMHPDRLRLEYEEPAGQLLICDGTTFWMVLTDGARPQVFKAPMGEKIGGFLSRAALKILTERHEPEYGGEERVDDVLCHRLSFLPKAGEEPNLFRDFQLWVGRDDLLTRRFCYVDPAGNRITYVFSAWSEVEPFPEGHFSYVPPPDADLFEESLSR